MRILLTGDLHIGRTSTRVPSDVPREQRSAVGAWRRIVELAIDEGCNAVCLAGDVADQDNKFWEAIGPLEKGVERLAQEGIRVVAVAGNHDHDVLARLADQLPEDRLTLLGRGGRWERTTLCDGEGRPRLHVDGWSFPKPRVLDDPLASYDLAPEGNAPILGLLHGDLDVPNSRYAPIGRDLLRQAAPEAWLLGHVHAPARHDLGGGSWALYPGSPQALDPGEPGSHGPWVVEVRGGRLGLPEQRPTSSVHYERLDVDLSHAEGKIDLERTVREAIAGEGERIVALAQAGLRHVSLRARLVGVVPVGVDIAAAVNGLVNEFEHRVGDVTVAVDALVDDTEPAIELERHAATRGAPGVLARLLLDLDAEEPSETTEALLNDARAVIGDVDADKAYLNLEAGEPDGARIRGLLRRQAWLLLRQLIAESS